MSLYDMGCVSPQHSQKNAPNVAYAAEVQYPRPFARAELKYTPPLYE